jgi:hypothetical protein
MGIAARNANVAPGASQRRCGLQVRRRHRPTKPWFENGPRAMFMDEKSVRWIFVRGDLEIRREWALQLSSASA